MESTDEDFILRIGEGFRQTVRSALIDFQVINNVFAGKFLVNFSEVCWACMDRRAG